MSKRLFVCLLTFLMLISIVGVSPFVEGDGGIIPYDYHDVEEPGQNAIIGWNGDEERMILSVDAKSEKNTTALHIVPFPSGPQMELGNVSSFEKVEELLGPIYGVGRNYTGKEGGAQRIEIIEHKQMGAHDLTTIKVNSFDDLSTWLDEFLKEKGVNQVELPEGTDAVIKDYVERGIRFFAIDIVELKKEVKTINPIIYTFDTDELFYPLEISSILKGRTEISLSLLTGEKTVLNCTELDVYDFSLLKTVYISQDQLSSIEEGLGDIFDGRVRLSFFVGNFDLGELKGDIDLKANKEVGWTTKHYEGCGIVGSLVYQYTNNPYYEYSNRIRFIDKETGDISFEWSPISTTVTENDKIFIETIKGINKRGTDYILIQGMYYQDYGENDSDEELVIIPFVAMLDEQGEEMWKREFEPVNTDKKISLRSIGVADLTMGKVVVVGRNLDHRAAEITAFDFEDGSEIYKKELSKVYLERLICVDDQILVLGWESLMGFSADKGDREWRSTCDDYLREDALVKEDIDEDGRDEVFLAGDNDIYRLDMEDGKLKSIVSKGSGYLELIDVRGHMLIYMSEGTVKARDLNKDKTIWQRSIEGERVQSIDPITTSDGAVVMSSSPGTINALDIGTGEERWSQRLNISYPSQTDIQRIDMGGEGEVVSVIHRNEIAFIRTSSGDLFYTFSTDESVSDVTGAQGDKTGGDVDVLIEGESRIIRLDTGEGRIKQGDDTRLELDNWAILALVTFIATATAASVMYSRRKEERR